MSTMESGRRTKNLAYMMKWSSAVLAAIGAGKVTRDEIEAACAAQQLPSTTTIAGEVKYTLQRLTARGRVRFDNAAKIWSRA